MIEQLRLAPAHMLLVFDEHGHFEGIITDMDLLEAVTGDFVDQDDPEIKIMTRNDGSLLVSVWMPVDEFAARISLSLPLGRYYETVAGLVLENKGMRGNGRQVVDQRILLRIAIAHAHFEAVHPFLDGNGRVGRLLIPLMLAAEGYEPVYISPWIEANKDSYYAALKEAQQRLDPSQLTAAIAEGISATELEINTTKQALQTLSETWSSSLKLRKNSSAERTLGILAYWPVLSVKTLTELLEVTAKAARDGIDQLVEAGLLMEITGNARNRIFIAPDVMRVVSRPFGTEPVLSEAPGVDRADEPGWR